MILPENENIVLEMSRWQAGASDVNLSLCAYPVMRRKGFWDEAEVLGGEYLQCHINQQLLHLFIELVEWHETHNADELADILIVLCDLAGGLGHSIYSGQVLPINMTDEPLELAIQRVANNWRKRGQVESASWRLCGEAIAREAHEWKLDLPHEFQKKMEHNMQRAMHYGTSKSAAPVTVNRSQLDADHQRGFASHL